VDAPGNTARVKLSMTEFLLVDSMETTRPHQIIEVIGRLLESTYSRELNIPVNRFTSSKIATVASMVGRLHPGLITWPEADRDTVGQITTRLIVALNKWYSIEFKPFEPEVVIQRSEIEALRGFLETCRKMTADELLWAIMNYIAQAEAVQRQSTAALIASEIGIDEEAIETAVAKLVADGQLIRASEVAYLVTDLGWSTFNLINTELYDETKGSESDSPSIKVFLCYTRNDQIAVSKLYENLRYLGVSPWMDVENIVGGQLWEEEIETAVSTADAVVVCISKASVSKEGFLQKEIKLVLDVADQKVPGTIFVIPLLLEPCEMPRRLSKLQYIRLFEPEGPTRLKRALDVVMFKKKTAARASSRKTT
jgi:TIR domain